MNANEPPKDMVLAFDAKRQAWQTSVTKGRITRLYFLNYEGEHMFEIDEGERRSSWPRPRENSWFVVGYFAQIEHTRGEHPEVLRIWIGNPDQQTPN